FAANPSHAVTALVPPAGVDASALVKRMRDVHGMVLAGGQDHLKGKIIRIGHMGAYDLGDIHALLGALEECAATLAGRPASVDGALATARAASEAWAAA